MRDGRGGRTGRAGRGPRCAGGHSGGGTGLGFWVWDEWNNLNVEHILIAIIIVGLVGLALEQALLLLAKRFDYAS